MPEKRVRGVAVREREKYADMSRDYTASDMQIVYEQSNPQGWDDAINWVADHGEAHAKITTGEAIAMKEDLQELKDRGVPFADDYQQAFRLAHRNRG